MASGVQVGATHGTLAWADCPGPYEQWTGEVTLPVINESYGREPKVFIGFDPFASHVIVADYFGQAYGEFVDAIADSILIDDETLKDYIVGYDSEGNPDYSEVEWTSGGEAVDTTYVTLGEVPVSAVTWLYRRAA